MKTLLIVESPAKCKTISKYLGPDYIVRASYGHVCDLAKGGKGKDRLGVDVENGFKPVYIVSADKKDKIAAILDAAKQVEKIYICSDPDREGENIAWCINQQLKNIKVPIKRVTFEEITKSALQKAIADPREIDLNLNDAQTARRVLDRLVGFMASPVLMSTMGPGLSAGRCQSIALRLIVDREREIEAFIPEVYWNVTANLAKKQDKFIAKYYPFKITDEKTALKIKDDLENSKFTVSNIESKQQKRNPNPPLTTSKMQQIAASIYKFSATRTMKAAQTLYEAGHISYMRTDSVRSSPEAISAVRDWISAQGHDLPDQPNIYKNKGAAQDAHEAIRPTDPSSNKIIGLAEDEAKLYKLIWERFVASQMKPAIYDTVLVHIKASKGHELRANGRTLQYPGWLAITEDFDDADKNITLPKLNVGDVLDLVPPGIKSERKETQPPPRYTDGSIIKELEERGIGRPSTFATILSKISDRNYVTKDKNQYTPTDLGRNVVDTLIKSFSFMQYEYTKDMETKLDKIEEGSVKYIDMMNEFFIPFSEEIKKAKNAEYKDGGEDCGNCGKRTILKHSKYGFFIACPDYPTCKFVKGVELDGDKIIVREKHVVIEDVECPLCGAGMIKRDGKFGPFYACSKYPKCKGNSKVPFGKKCPQCNNELYLTVYQDKPVLFCMGYKAGCRHSETPPEGTQFSDPKKLVPKDIPKKIKRHFKSS